MNVRPYEDFGLWGKLVKASVPLRRSGYFQFYYRLPTRCIRWLHSSLGDRRLRYRRLEPNYEVYWEPDSDAAVSLDSFETFLWFRARGDTCLSCGAPRQELWQNRDPMVIRVRE
mgnify:CR=1 FL=1